LIVVRYFDWLPKRELCVADHNSIEITKSDRLMHPPFVQKSSVAASQSINQNSPTFCRLMSAPPLTASVPG
jgi:hypothetical protein